VKLSPLTEKIGAGALAAIFLLGAAMLWSSWRTARRNSDALKAVLAARAQEIAADGEQIEALNARIRQAGEDAAKVKAETKTPAAVLKALPAYLPLPKPLDQAYPCGDVASGDCAPPSSLAPEAPDVHDVRAHDNPISLPAEDLKPLFDFAVDCHACQLKAAAEERELALKDQEIAALTAEKNAAVKAGKGGGFWGRLRSNIHWFAIGGAAAAAAICATGHCK